MLQREIASRKLGKLVVSTVTVEKEDLSEPAGGC
jgi:hypothetical protein